MDTVGYTSITALPDTGANKSIISEKALLDRNITYGTRFKGLQISTANNSPLECLGSVNLNVFYEDFVTPIHALVSNTLRETFLISWHDLRQMRILPSTYPHVATKTQVLSISRPEKGKKLEVAQTFTADSLESLCEQYEDVFKEDTLTPMSGEPMKIHLRRDDVNYKPLRIFTARRTPLHYKSEADKLINNLLETGVIEKVPPNENVEWCSPGFFIPKSNGKVRLVTDYRQINQFIDRPVHPFPTCKDIIRGILPDSRWFLKFDAVHGYFQVPLDDDSARLTTFLIETGRYRFLRAPMGLNPSSDHFCARSDAALSDIDGLLKIVDDGLIQAKSKADLLKKFHKVLESCRKSNLTLSKSKLQLGQSVIFAGYVISQDGVKPEPRKTDAIRLFPTPTNITELRGFLGLANQLGIFVPDLAHATQPLRQLLKKNVAYLWLSEHREAFEKVKELLLSKLVLQPFNSSLSTQLLTDASRLKGLGYGLIQTNADSTILNLIQCGSRSLLPAESRYSTTELECLAIYYAIHDSAFYLQGTKFTVITDHKPLVGIFAKALADIENARLLRYREKLASFSFEVKHVPGKSHLIADAFSRAPVFSPSVHEEVIINNAIIHHIASDPALQHLFDFASADQSYQSIVTAVLQGKSVENLPPNHPARVYRSIWNDISVLDDVLLVYNNSRIVVPADARPSILEQLHMPHAGIGKTRQLARQLYYWPGMSIAISNKIENCVLCQTLRPSLHEVSQQHPQAEAPMHSLSVDLFSWAGKDYLVTVDRFSYYIWVDCLAKTNTSTITAILDEKFEECGYPFIIISDNGPQFRNEFKEYCIANNIIHTTSSPYNPRSNGLAESAVKQAKMLLRKSNSFKVFKMRLIAYRNTPSHGTNLSPSERFYSRRQRMPNLPTLPTPAAPHPPATDNSILPPLQVGEFVRLQHPIHGTWERTGKIMRICDSGLSYEILDSDGTTCTRGRRMVKKDTTAERPPSPVPSPPASTNKGDAPRRSRRQRKKPIRYQAHS